MSEIREELEHFAKLAEEQAVKEETASKQTVSDDNGDTSPDSADEYLKAPKGYSKEFAESFASLPKEWRRYLNAREEEIDKGFSSLRSRKEMDKKIDEIYAKRNGELQGYGIKSQEEWLENLVQMDEMLSRYPADAIKMLAEIYNIKFPAAAAPVSAVGKSRSQAMQDHLIKKQLDDFVAAVNENGEKQHPFYHDVVREMSDLLSSGLAQNYDEAYEKAVWFNPETRARMLAERTQVSLELKSKDAKKAKDAAFAPKGKTVAEAKDLTLREELEMRFAALTDEE